MSPPLSAKSPSSALVYFVIAAVVLVHLLSASWHIFTGSLNADEGFYAIATRSVAHGEMPYRDFGFTQPPLVLYANALPLRLLGFGLFPQRALNGAWTALALLLAVRWLARRTQLLWALGVALLFSLSAPWMYFSHLGKTYGFTTLLVMLAAWVFLTAAKGPRRNFALGLLFALGAATRLPAIPFFGMLWLLALWPAPRPTLSESFAALGGLAAGLSVALLPFFLVAKDAARPFFVETHGITVRAVGTAFSVQAKATAVEIFVKEGAVDVGHTQASGANAAAPGPGSDPQVVRVNAVNREAEHGLLDRRRADEAQTFDRR